MDWLTRVERACAEPLGAKALRERLLGLVRARVPFDGHVFALTDPVTMIATSPHADVPMLPWERLPEIIRWRYLTEVNRVDRLVGQGAVSLIEATGGDRDSAPIWRHVQSDLGLADTATVGFADRYGVWGFLELWRDAPFTSDELDLLTAMQPAVTAGLRATVARTFVDMTEPPAELGAAVLLLGPDLAVRSQTEAAASRLMQLLPPEEAMAPVPAAAFNVGAALLAAEDGVPLGECWGRVHLGGNRWVTVKASRLGDDLAVSIESSTPAERSDLFARAAGLSGRESEVLGLLAIGLDTGEIAAALFLSEHTVSDHVKSVLAKSGARTRQVLLSRALGAA